MRFACILFGLIFGQVAAAQEKFTLKAEANGPPSEVSEAIRKLLAKSSYAVRDANGTVAEFWLREELPGKGTAEQIKNGLTYREVVETCLLGVVKFPNTFIDYRKQEILAGVYTLRLAYQPDTGDHNDTAPHTEFALLCPVDKDTKTDEMEPKTLYKMSFAATGGEHPGVMLLYPNKVQKEPKLQDREKNVWTLNFSRPVVSDAGKVELGFAITVAGFSKLR